MKVIGISGSPRKNGNTSQAMESILEIVSKQGIETEFISLAGKDVGGCIVCGKCRKQKDGRCYGRDDDIPPIIEKCLNSDAIILGSPVYFGSATPEIKCLIDRLGYAGRSGVNLLKNKVGGAVVIARRAGQNFTFAQLSYFFSIMGMIQIGSSYWNILFGKEKGDIHGDEEGMDTISQYAENLIWMLKKIQNG